MRQEKKSDKNSIFDTLVPKKTPETESESVNVLMSLIRTGAKALKEHGDPRGAQISQPAGVAGARAAEMAVSGAKLRKRRKATDDEIADAYAYQLALHPEWTDRGYTKLTDAAARMVDLTPRRFRTRFPNPNSKKPK